MATFKTVVQKMRADGFYPVYIRVTHYRKVGYIKTDKVVHHIDVSKNKEILDNYVLNYCTRKILEFTKKLNKQNLSAWTLREVIDFLTTDERSISFSAYARKYVSKLNEDGRLRSARNYRLAVAHLERYLGTTDVKFSQLTSMAVNFWIETLAKTHRAKEMYPVCVRQIFRAAVLEYNDYDTGLIQIASNPWPKVVIPQSDRTTKRAISPENLRKFFAAPFPESRLCDPLPELGHDVAKLVFCLAGINTVDLYNLQKSDYRKGLICYKRAKTRNSRRDEAYIEMRVEPVIQPLLEKYKTEADDPYLFSFHTRYRDSDSFNANVNHGIKRICKSMGLRKDRWYCVYTFRHSWATVAQNDCGANIAEVGFAMNHSHGHAVTRGYIKFDFSPAWELNAKVIDFVLFSTKRSKQGEADDIDNPLSKQFRLSPKRMVNGRAYFKGEVVAELSDIGFSNVDSVIDRLVPQLPDTIPPRCEVTFRIKDIDTDMEGIYTRTKGKGF